MASETPILDSHVHLFPEASVPDHHWYQEGIPMAKQHSVDDYKTATGEPISFIYLEADRKSDPEPGADNAGWKGPLDEVSFVKRIATGQPIEGQGHTAEDASLCRACIPWAPMPAPPESFEKYIEAVKAEAGDSWPKVRGFRYLLQDKPHGTAIGNNFIANLKLLGRLGLAFDVGIDQHRRGRTQLEQAVEMIDLAHEGVPEEEKVTFIINHMGKPDLEVYNVQMSTSFIAWRTAMFTFAKCSKTYMKLSGGFSEMPESLRNRPAEDIFDACSPWLSVLLAAFGPSRLLFASDWPVCALGFENPGEAWAKWRKVVERMCWMATMEDEDKQMIFSGTAVRAYSLESFSFL